MVPQIGSQWIAKWAVGNPNAYIWTVRGVTEHGVYITSPGSHTPGHLLSPEDFNRDYVARERLSRYHY